MKPILFFLLISLLVAATCNDPEKTSLPKDELLTADQIDKFQSIIKSYLSIYVLKTNERELDFALRNINEDASIGYKKYVSKTLVFELYKDFPGIIFKFSSRKSSESPKRVKYRGSAYNRYENAVQVAQILKNYPFDALELPKFQYFEFTFNNYIVEIFAERKFDIYLPNGQFPKHTTDHGYTYLFNNLTQNQKAVTNVKKIIYQLVGFICKTGFWDIQAPNIPLEFTNGIPQKLILVDTNDLFNYKQDPNFNLLDQAQEGVLRVLDDTIISSAPHGKELGYQLALEVKKAYEFYCNDSIDNLRNHPYTSYKNFNDYLNLNFPGHP